MNLHQKTQLARLTVIAALVFIALRPAQAEDSLWKRIIECDDVSVDHVHLSDLEEYRIDIVVEHKQKKRPPVVVFDPRKQSLTLDGKRCSKKVD